MILKETIKTELDRLGWTVQRLANESGVRYASLLNFLNNDKELISQNLDKVLKVLANTEIFYNLKQEIGSGDTDMYLKFTDGLGRCTQYSPVILSIYKIDDAIIYYTESKTGDLKHAFSVKEKKFIEISLLENLEPVAEIIDYIRF